MTFSFFLSSCTSVLFSKLSRLLVNSVWSSVEASRVQGGRKSLQLFDAQEYEHLPVRWKRREERRQEGRSREREFEFLRASIYLFQRKQLCASYVPGLMLPSSHSELAITSSFPLQIKDQSLNTLSSFSTRLWLKPPPASHHSSITSPGQRRSPSRKSNTVN